MAGEPGVATVVGRDGGYSGSCGVTGVATVVDPDGWVAKTRVAIG